MSLVPLLFHDWWEDYDHPMRLLDQHFGMGLNRNDLLTSLHATPSLFRGGYYRPWRSEISERGSSSTIKKDSDKFQITLDVQQFKPNEIMVKTKDNYVIVEGKHEEKQDEHGFISRHFVRRYMLPKGHESADVVSSLSSDGVLTITAPTKNIPPVDNERVVPITQSETDNETKAEAEAN
ncbi:protein lethal(2)essential for life-like [Ctenocephalides felis]|uniref:protein lethal(2)essential for life-like n=1 Tax=Ctenocephalides felis TaxID=7515 RepID=UPI000E6E12A5|nr:protein lethal(2)essential for life-like [Ctenocephalides felis]